MPVMICGKALNIVIPRAARNLPFLEFTQREIPRCARNDKINPVLHSLFNLSLFCWCSNQNRIEGSLSYASFSTTTLNSAVTP
jgi:hypothetical protein